MVVDGVARRDMLPQKRGSIQDKCEAPPMDYAETVMMGSHVHQEFTRHLQSEKNFARSSRRFRSLREGDKNLRPAEIEPPEPRSRCAKLFTCADCPHVREKAQVLTKTALSKLGEEWIFLLLLGVIMACLSYLMDFAIFKFQEANINWYYRLKGRIFVQYIVWVFFPIIFITFATGFVHLVGPNAVGSGIPEMKTIIRGVTLTDYLSFRTLVSKVVGLTISLGSGMPIGKEGPFVHIASMVATLLSKFVTSFQGIYENQTRNTEMLAAACAVGVACNFAAPIGGVLFSIEVTSTFFAVRNYWRGFFGAVVGALVFQLIGLYADEEETITALYVTNFPIEIPYDPLEIFVFAFVGIVCGFAGALYVWFHRKVVLLMRDQKIHKLFMKNRFIYPSLITLFIASITFPPGLGKFFAADLTSKSQINDLFTNYPWTGQDHTQEQLNVISHWTAPYGGVFLCLACFCLSKFILSAFALTMPVPSGVFIPAFLIGAGYGRLVGECMYFWFPSGFAGVAISPGGYALVGAASMSGSVTHTISTSVIVFELTGQMSHGLPVLVSVILANVVAQCLQPSIYDSIIQIKRLPFLPDIVSASRRFYDIMADDIMVTKFNYICFDSSYKSIYAVIRSLSSTQVLPLVESHESMVLLGTVRVGVLQEKINQHLGKFEQLEFIAAGKDWQALQAEGAQQSSRSAAARAFRSGGGGGINEQSTRTQEMSAAEAKAGHKVRRMSNMFSGSLYNVAANDNTVTRSHNTKLGVELRETLGDAKLSQHELDRWEELRMKMRIEFEFNEIDASPFSIVGMTNLPKVHSLFSLLGLREAYVTRMGKLVGVITLNEIRKAVEQTSNVGKGQPPPQQEPSPAFTPELNVATKNLQHVESAQSSTSSSSDHSASGDEDRAVPTSHTTQGRFTSVKVHSDAL